MSFALLIDKDKIHILWENIVAKAFSDDLAEALVSK